MPTVQFFWDNNQGAQTGWNRLQLTSGTTGNGVSIASGSVVDPANSVVSGVGIDLSGITGATVFNSTTGPATTSGDAAWVSPASHFGDALQLSTVDLFYPHVIPGLGTTPHTVELFGTSASGANNRYMQARVNGGTVQVLNISNAQGTNILRFENIAPVAGEITIEVARHSSSTGGNAYFYVGRIFEYVASPTMTVTTDDIQPETAENILCTNFDAAPDDTTMALNAFDDGVGTNSMALSVTVTDNLDGTYDLDFTPPALPASGSASYIRFTDEDAGITHTISIDTV